LKFVSWYIWNPDHYKSVFESFRKFFTATIAFTRVLRGKYSELRVGFDYGLSLNYMHFSIIIQKSIECFKYFRRSQVELIKDDPVTLSYSLNKSTFSKHQFTLIGSIRDVTTKVFLHISMHMIIDPKDFVMCSCCQVVYTRGLSSRSGTFQNNSKISNRNHRRQLSKKFLERGSQDEVFLIKVLRGKVSKRNQIIFNIGVVGGLFDLSLNQLGHLFYFEQVNNQFSDTLLESRFEMTSETSVQRIVDSFNCRVRHFHGLANEI
jgi:hypothetical protein